MEHTVVAKKVVKGKTNVVLPELLGPTMMGARVVFDGPDTITARNANASSTELREVALAAKNC